MYVREIFVSTEGKTEEEKVTLRAKADGLLARVKAGEDFGELAKRFSDAGTAKAGGELGLFRRGVMDPALEQAVFKLNRNDFTDVIPIATGFEILQVMERYEAGQQPLEKVGSRDSEYPLQPENEACAAGISRPAPRRIATST